VPEAQLNLQKHQSQQWLLKNDAKLASVFLIVQRELMLLLSNLDITESASKQKQKL
jgi:hypothetical protein